MKRLFNFQCDEELIKLIEEVIDRSNNQYKDKTHFIILALQEKIEREKTKESDKDVRP